MKSTPRQTMIPLPGGKLVPGVAQHGPWSQGALFYYAGRGFEFLGRDEAGGLHARGEHGRLYCFQSSDGWHSF